jgi:phage shock protein C
MKKLYRSRDNKIVAGVFGGLEDFLHVDATILRLVWIFITIFSWLIPGVVVYILAALIMPLEPKEITTVEPIKPETEQDKDSTTDEV